MSDILTQRNIANGEAMIEGLGARRDRADGRLKVQGLARYAVDHPVENLCHAIVVQSTIPEGEITHIDCDAARQMPGVLAVYTHESGLTIHPAATFASGGAAAQSFVPLQGPGVRWNGQHVALVVAETLEQAKAAAATIHIDYEVRPAIIHPDDPLAQPKPVGDLDIEWGDAQQALREASVTVSGVYTTPREYNLPIELHGCIADWRDGEITLWEPSQWVGGARSVVAQWMGIDIEKVRVLSPFTGGGFGSKGGIQPHSALACAASRALGRPVKLVLTRGQTFTGFGGRPRTRQALQLAADSEGKLQAIVHESWNETARDDTHLEPCNSVTAIMYAVPNFISRHQLVPVNTVNPGWMRAPGENPSSWAIEVAMDELAYALKLDPLELRLRNYADEDPQAKIPWSSRRLREAYQAGAQAFGWAQRPQEPGTLREGRQRIGWGMASGSYPVRRTPGEAAIRLNQDGTLEVRSSGADIGTGTYTILAQTAAEVLSVASDRISVSLGDTDLPRAPVAGGSQLANLLTAAVYKTALKLREELITLAVGSAESPLFGARREDVILEQGQLRLFSQPGSSLSFADLLRCAGRDALETHADTFPPDATQQDREAADRTSSKMIPPTAGGYSAHSWSAIFVEVAVDEDFGTVRVRRIVGAFDSGRLYNPKLAESQWIGAMVMGIGQALLEEGEIDDGNGRILNASLADYLVAVNADIPDMAVINVGEPDYQASALGGKAVGELGIVGVAAAIANAVFHATGKRIRDLPITLEKMLAD
ncbi:MAG: xanthine dehydrogenase family protein molybdopterin-binding subunit [Mixta calida]|uniref:Xanthine dehydrogenase family protein molybdopterin-binding subunit n=2 Tax=Mixta calida TaxID=665913 RepID=A0ABM6S2I0_9GAMM|nr:MULTISPECIES: xanthine dehydrogenase family protein molybdopterin-binding subunit [Mixta]POU47947.1 xanthine dehydrogenase family protein molybdopterin-binding subunit [Pantoea sp. PSNIH5]POU66254.1 xanthine dehydrogenase family protein molybdopterin-binding subunit [Pantoea sp. PSNIH4]POY67911.1 xanthine dehydrogenase family protein molybdopterin-binding subunit [Pantoea sp. PSNIH3]AUY25797.1 xanthine dehydrogenase family protein molybdopterin-binding subunit [Mixta calida]KAF0861118.1 hyp